ncbi:MAG: HAMP domain-containing protein [Acidobacteriaceae bacterium]|nr:HAMP domain-containing protein [Acidobacteriaceae bacterium]
MRTNSLVRRATVAVLAIEMLCALGMAAVALWHERETRLRALDATLQGRSDSLIGAVQDAEDPEDNVKVDREEFSPGKGEQFAVYKADGRIIGASQGDLSAVALGARNGFHNITVHDHQYRVLQQKALRIIDRVETGGVGLRRPITVVYAVRSDHVWREVLDATSFYLLLSLASVCLTAVLLVLLARRLLRPLNELASAASSIKPSVLQFSAPPSALETAELRPLADSLARMVARLRHAFEAERRFVSDAAHELKTAVAVVRSTIQVLGMRTRSAQEYRAGLDRILEDNQRVEELVSRMLTLAQFEERAAGTREQIDLGSEAAAAVRNLASYAEWKGVALHFAEDRGVKVQMDPEAIQTLVSNLVMNAVQHSGRGSEVRVSVRSNGDGPGKATLEVQDHGTGISAENLSHVFERFFREDPSRSRETGGAGLGLSICKSIVENAGGSIEIRSEPGKGTTVTALLEAADQER